MCHARVFLVGAGLGNRACPEQVVTCAMQRTCFNGWSSVEVLAVRKRGALLSVGDSTAWSSNHSEGITGVLE